MVQAIDWRVLSASRLAERRGRSRSAFPLAIAFAAMLALAPGLAAAQSDTGDAQAPASGPAAPPPAAGNEPAAAGQPAAPAQPEQPAAPQQQSEPEQPAPQQQAEPEQPPQQQAAPDQATAPQPPAAPPQPAAGAAPAPASETSAAVRPNMPTPAEAQPPAEIDGRPLVRDTATLVIDGKAVLLAGIDGVGGEAAGTIQDHIAAAGDRVSCTPAPDMPGFYTCHLADGTDLAKLLLVNGLAHVAPGAPDDYAVEQGNAVQNKRGIWGLQDACVGWAVNEPVATVAFTDDADEGLYFYNLEPYVLLAGVPVAVVFDAALGGWGYDDGSGHWTAAPDRWSKHLNNVYPHGAGLRDAGARTRDLQSGKVREDMLRHAEVHQRTMEQTRMMSDRLGRPPVAPENVRPAVLRERTPAMGTPRTPGGIERTGLGSERPGGAGGPHPGTAAERERPGVQGERPGMAGAHPNTPAMRQTPAMLARPMQPRPMPMQRPAPHFSAPTKVSSCKKPPC